MSDVRILAPLSGRGTGIPRTSTQVPQRNPTGTANSHVSASPSAGARAQAQVASVRRPSSRRQDTTVVLLDRPATRSAPAAAQPVSAAPAGAGPAVAASQGPTVQFVERTRPPAAAAAAFTVEQMMLMGFLLDRYRENTIAINDAQNTAIAEGALAVLGGFLQAAGAPVAPAPVAAPAPAPASGTDAADEPDAGTRSRSGARSRSRRADGKGGEATANVAAPSAPNSSAESSSSGSDGIPSSPAMPTGERGGA